jgi:hypothetical protein
MNRIRYATLLHNERSFPAHLDHGTLIAPACCILESELDRLVATPALGVVDHLVAALRDSRKNEDQAVTLERWAAGRAHSTLGILTNVFVAMRRAIEQGSEPIREFLATRFSAAYLKLLESKNLDQCLNRINPKYRIPACHGLEVFDEAAYTEFVRLVVANQRFVAWNADGPFPRPAAVDAGILHHHLFHSRAVSPAPDVPAGESPAVLNPVARLVALETPPGSPLAIEIAIEPVASHRDVVVRPTTQVPTFRVGDQIRFRIQANRSCHLMLVDIGTSGQVTVLLPNAWRADGWIEGGDVHFLPNVENAEFAYELSGQPGQERIVAISSLETLQLVSPLPQQGNSFRVLHVSDVERLVNGLESGPVNWAVARCAFSID